MSEKLRGPNFTTSEKLHLLRIIANKYSSIIEDKKTDRASGEKKEKAWQQITDNFNASSSTGILRSISTLKKCYENRKKELRKSLADEKREVTLTGGGPPPKVKKDETDDLLMSIINKNTLVGFKNKFDDDADENTIERRDPDKNNEVEFYIIDDGVAENIHARTERKILPIDKISQSIDIETEDIDWRKYNATKLKEPISSVLATNSTTLVTDKIVENVPDHAKTTPKSRRRPTTVVKSLTSSEIAKKYDLLLDKRLMLAEGQLHHMEQENALVIKKRKLEIELLEVELLIKKKNL